MKLPPYWLACFVKREKKILKKCANVYVNVWVCMMDDVISRGGAGVLFSSFFTVLVSRSFSRSEEGGKAYYRDSGVGVCRCGLGVEETQTQNRPIPSCDRHPISIGGGARHRPFASTLRPACHTGMPSTRTLVTGAVL